MKTIQVATNCRSITCPNDDDVTLVLSDEPRIHHLDIVGQGRSMTLTGPQPTSGKVWGNLGNQLTTMHGTFDRALITGVTADITGQDGDVFDVSCVARILNFNWFHFRGIAGKQSGIHGDGIQACPGCKVQQMRVTNGVIMSAYQAIMIWADTEGGGVQEVFFDRLNILDEPVLRDQQSIAFYLGDKQGQSKYAANRYAPVKVTFGEDVYADWPSKFTPGDHVSFFSDSTKPVGTVKLGRPPGGNYFRLVGPNPTQTPPAPTAAPAAAH